MYKILKASVLSSIASLAMLLTGVIFTVSVTNEADPELIKNSINISYSLEELDRHEKEFIESINEIDPNKSREAHFEYVSNQSKFYIWLPWFLLPFFVSIMHRYLISVAFLLPVLLYLLSAYTLDSLIVCLFALILGNEVKQLYTKKHITNRPT